MQTKETSSQQYFALKISMISHSPYPLYLPFEVFRNKNCTQTNFDEVARNALKARDKQTTGK